LVHANRVCRVAALAVVLGVGAGLATTPAIGHATTGASGASGSDSSSTSSASSSTAATGASRRAGSTGRGAGGRTTNPSVSADSASAPIHRGGSSPAVTVGGTGRAHLIAPETRGAGSDRDIGDGEVAGDGGAVEAAASAPTQAAPTTTSARPDEPAASSSDSGSTEVPAAAAELTAAGDSQLSVAPTPEVHVAAGPTAAQPDGAHARVADAVIKVASDLVAAAFGPLPAPGGGTTSPALWAVLAWARREIGHGGQTPSAATSAPLSQVESAVHDAAAWIQTNVDLQPWISGQVWLPTVLRPILFNHTPVASPTQVEVDLGQGVTSGAIPLTAYDPDGDSIVYSVPGEGMPGGPSHGTVVVDKTAGTFTYTPDEDFTGTDTFSFVVTDHTDIHLHAWRNLVNAAFGIFGTGLAGGHTDTATVTVFNGVPIQPDPGVAAYTDITGDFSVLTYNVAGQPLALSGGAWPRLLSMLKIGSLINGFDIVNVQGDVAYHPFLFANTVFPDRTAPQVPAWLWPVGVPFSDGLNTLSAYAIEGLNRQGWDDGAGDFLTPQGFTYSRTHIPGGSSIDVYNVDTGGGSFTDADLEQLSGFIQQNSVGRAVIVMGDFGQLYSDPAQTLSQFAADNGLTDAWVELEKGGVVPVDTPTCKYADSCEQPDKVFYRGAAPLDPDDPATSPVQLHALTYTNEGLNFLDGNGTDLSDHRPQSVTFGYSVDAVGPMNIDLENWMASLPGVENLPLTQLPIPGTHDSGSYGITPGSPWALTGRSDFGQLAELPAIVEDLVVKPIAAAWARTQEKDLYGQFEDGIRYVDLRLSHEPDGQIYIEHGLRGPSADEVIDDIARYATTHPREVVIVDAARFTNFDSQTHQQFLAKLREALGTRMVPREVGTSVTLGELWDMDKNVIVLYDQGSVVAANNDLWYDNTVYGPWHNVQTVGALLDGNEQNLANRPSGTIWGLSGNPTPDTSTIVAGLLTLGPMSNKAFTWDVHPALQQWMRTEFKDSVNLVTTDWYQQYWLAGSSYARDVLGAGYETLASRLSAMGAGAKSAKATQTAA